MANPVARPVPLSVSGCTALVTGANQGIGLGFVEALLARGAKKVYATGRRPETLEAVVSLDTARVTAAELDIGKADHRTAVAKRADDIDLLINNAGIPGSEHGEERRFLAAPNLDDARQVMEIDYWAQAEMCRAFAPAMIERGRGTIVNILSVGAMFCLPEYSTYCAAKAAAAIMTQGVRAELAPHRLLVAGVYTGGVATRMSAKNHQEHMSPIDHANQVLDALEAGEEDIFAGARADLIRDAVRSDPKAFERTHIERFHTAPMD